MTARRTLALAAALTALAVGAAAAGVVRHDLRLPSGAAATPALVGAAKADPTGRTGAGGRFVAYHAGQRRVGSAAAQPRLFRPGFGTNEPSLGIAPDGWVYTQAGQIQTVGPVFHTVHTVIRTKDGSRFQVVGPTAGGQATHQYTEDPYLYVDPTTGRVFDNDLLFPCQQTALSDDGGASWTEAVTNCDQADHQNLFAGPAPEAGDAPSGYPNVVYDCAINGGALAGTSSAATSCDKSLDGGRTFLPTGGLAFVADPAKDVPPGTCDGATGHGFADRRGTVYLPRGWCGQPWLAISKDEGQTWSRVQVAANGMNSGTDGPPDNLPVYDHEAAVVADARGNVYYTWVAYDYKPYLSVSRDGGAHWSRPLMVAPPGVRQAALPALAIGPDAAPGRIALAFMGSSDAPKNPYPRDDAHYAKASWSGYVVTTETALAADPLFIGGAVNDPRDPLVRGTCGPVRCQAEYDFIDVEVGPKGQPWAVFVDACPRTGACGATGEAVLATVLNGPRLVAAKRP